MSSAAAATATRHRLRLGVATLKVLKGAAERALNIPAARSARAISGRAAAAAALVGRRTRAVKLQTNACRVVVERPVDLTPRQRRGGLVKKKKRSGRVRRLARSRSRDPLSYRSLSLSLLRDFPPTFLCFPRPLPLSHCRAVPLRVANRRATGPTPARPGSASMPGRCSYVRWGYRRA